MLTLITNRKLTKDENLVNIIEKAVAGGIDAIILREKDLPNEALLSLAYELKNIIGEKKVLLMINSNVEVAKAVNADGLHLGFEAFITNKPDFNGLIGVSVHSLEEAILAEKTGADYILASHVFETSCKPDLEPRGLVFIKNILASVSVPVIALGGITNNNVRSVVSTGVDGIAIMSGIMTAKDPYEATCAFKKCMK